MTAKSILFLSTAILLSFLFLVVVGLAFSAGARLSMQFETLTMVAKQIL